jgi:predicted P-loop ATPase
VEQQQYQVQQYREIQKYMDFYLWKKYGGTTFSRKQQTAYRVECVEAEQEVDFINGVPNTGFETRAGFRFYKKQQERHFLSQTQTNICFQRTTTNIHNRINRINKHDNRALRVLGGAGIGKNLNVE